MEAEEDVYSATGQDVEKNISRLLDHENIFSCTTSWVQSAAHLKSDEVILCLHRLLSLQAYLAAIVWDEKRTTPQNRYKPQVVF